MAQYDYPKGLIQRALREGANPTEGLRLFREHGGRIRTETWYRMWGQAQLEGVTASKEFQAPLRRIPTAGEIQTTTSRRARGYMQRVVVMGRDKDGLVISRDVSFRTDNLRSRQAVIDRAMSLVQSGMEDEDTKDRYPLQAIIGGFYQGTYDFAPEE